MENTCDITHNNPTNTFSDVGSVLRGRDLEQRERKLMEAQKELLNDRETLEKTNDSAKSIVITPCHTSVSSLLIVWDKQSYVNLV